jgi:hypothetical protein
MTRCELMRTNLTGRPAKVSPNRELLATLQQAGIANSAWTVQASVARAAAGFAGNRRAGFNGW